MSDAIKTNYLYEFQISLISPPVIYKTHPAYMEYIISSAQSHQGIPKTVMEFLFSVHYWEK